MDGLISFFGSYHALRAESMLKREGFVVRLIPGPKELSPNCGVALRFQYDERDRAAAILERNRVQFEALHVYRPRSDEWFTRRVVSR
jgi:Putative Se/S carrier protein-like